MVFFFGKNETFHFTVGAIIDLQLWPHAFHEFQSGLDHAIPIVFIKTSLTLVQDIILSLYQNKVNINSKLQNWARY